MKKGNQCRLLHLNNSRNLYKWMDIKKSYIDRFGYTVQETDDYVTFTNEFGLTEFRKYKGNDAIVTIPDGVNVISSDSFYRSKVEEVVLPDSVLAISHRAFQDCNCLKSITIPESIEAIDDYAFDGCISLQSINIPEHLERLQKYAFSNTGLKTAIFPRGIKDSPYGPVYKSCPNLEKAIIMESEMVFNTGEFSKCDKLKDIYYDGPVKNLPPLIKQKIEKKKSIVLHKCQEL